MFPDARFVMTHRDPTEVMVSVADVYAEVGRQFSVDIDLRYLGRAQRAALDEGDGAPAAVPRRRTATTASTTWTSGPCSSDPIGQVRGLYAWLDEPVTDAFAHGMRRWWETNAEHREANIHPDPSEFGLDLDQVRGMFAEYSAKIPEWTALTAPASQP